MARADARGFGWIPTQQQIDERRPLIDLERFRIAADGGRIVGIVGSFAFDVTVPGGTTIPTSGVTWVAVAATHRRRGILTELMGRVHADAADRGDPVATLFASEGGIYERFGYGIASTMRFVDIDRPSARLRPDLPIDRDSVRYVEGDDAAAIISSGCGTAIGGLVRARSPAMQLGTTHARSNTTAGPTASAPCITSRTATGTRPIASRSGGTGAPRTSWRSSSSSR